MFGIVGGDYLGEIFKFISKVFLGIIGIAAGLVDGTLKSSLSYFKGVSYSFSKNYSMKAKEEFDEPAKENYFFYRQYENLLNTYRSATSINTGNNLILRQQLEERNYYVSSRAGAAQIVINILGTLLNITCFIIHFLIITTISIPIYIFYCIVMSVEKLRFIKGRIWGICPHCHYKFDIPYYICPDCGHVHKRLTSGPYGIIKRRCMCGQKIPATNFLGRFRLKAVCPECSKEIESREASPICIPIVGGRTVGKTSFMYSTVSTLVNQISREKKWNIRFINEYEEDKFIKASALINKGILPEKTNKSDTPTHNVFISSERFSSEKLLYLYDIAGEFFDLRATIRRQNYYRYIEGLIFIIDPLSLHSVKQKEEFKDIKASDTNVNDLIDRFVLGLREIRQVQLSKLIDIPVAVVVNKMDVIGYQGDVLDFIKEMGEEKVIRKFEHNFSNYKFFSCSTLGKVDKDELYEIKGVAEPIEWILSNANKELR